MDRTEIAAPPRQQSQSRLPPAVLWVVAAAAVFRIATAILDRGEADDGLVRWQPREKAAALALASRRPILYDFGAAWCGPCKLLDGDWKDPAIAQTVNDGFVPSRIVDRQREEGKNPPDIAALQERFQVGGFPTLVAVTPDGRLIAKLEGYRGREALVNFLNEARK